MGRKISQMRGKNAVDILTCFLDVSFWFDMKPDKLDYISYLEETLTAGKNHILSVNVQGRIFTVLTNVFHK